MEKKKYAGFWVRFSATLVDLIIMLALLLAKIILIPKLSLFSVNDKIHYDIFSLALLILALLFAFTGLQIIYTIILTINYGGTLGKLLFGLKVISLNEKEITFKQALIREVIGKPVSFVSLCLGFFWIAFDRKKQGWHDKFAKTLVVHKK